MEPTTGKAKYYTLMEALKEQILSGTIKPGQKLPSENELTREYALSRHTVRKALALLENEGYITAQHGKGTFCSERVIQRHNSKNIAVTGYDNSLIGQSSPIGITTIAHPQEKLGEMAAELILEKIRKVPEEESSVKRLISPELIVRESTAGKICQQRRKNRKEPKGGKNNGNGCKNSNPRTENSTWY